MRRREFMKGAAALFGTVAMTWGGRTVTAAEDAASDAVVQEGADMGLYSQELADEIIGFSSPKGNITLDDSEELVAESDLVLETPDSSSETKVVKSTGHSDPVHGILATDWSKVLEEFLDEGLEIHCHPYVMQSGDIINRFIQPEIKIRNPMEERELITPVKTEQLKLDHFYCSFVIKDREASMSAKEVIAYFFMPALHSMARELNNSAKDGQLWVAPLGVMPAAAYCGVKQALCDGGRVPVRVSMQYDVAHAGTRVDLDFLAHCPHADSE